MSGFHQTHFSDPPEAIQLCLSCPKPACDNCLDKGPYDDTTGRPASRHMVLAEQIRQMCLTTDMTDAAIAEALGISTTNVYYYRLKTGTPNYRTRTRASRARGPKESVAAQRRRQTDARIAELLDEGYSDCAIADLLGMHHATVTSRRHSMGLLSSQERKMARRKEQVRVLYDEGLTDKDIAARTGIPLKQVSICRQRLGLASKHKGGGAYHKSYRVSRV